MSYTARWGRPLVGCLVLCLMIALPGRSMAGTVTAQDFQAIGPLSLVNGHLKYDGVGVLTVTLTNNSPEANGGYVTGFVFNIDGDATATLASGPEGFYDLGYNKASPFGWFEAGAALGKKGKGDFNGGGDPKPGIAVGETGVFVFNVTGDDAGGLTAMSFLTEETGSGDNVTFFATRLRGFNDGSSNHGEGQLVPLPASVWCGLGLMGALLAVRIKRRLAE